MRPVPIALALIAVAAGGFTWSKLHAPKPKGKTQYTLAVATRGTVKKTVSASGTLVAWTTVDVKSKAGGRIDTLAVDVGSRVKSGQIIAKIDPTDSLLTYNQAKASTESAKAKETQSGETYTLTVSQADIAVQQAKANLDSASASLGQAEARYRTAQTENRFQPALTSAAIAQAKATFESAVQARAKLVATQSQDRASAKSAYDQAIANDKNAQANLTRQRALLAKGFVAASTVDAAEANAGVTTATVASAKSKLDTIEAQQKAERDSAEAEVQQTLAAYKSAQTNSFLVVSKQNSLAEQQAAVLQSRAAVETARAQLNDAIAARRKGPISRLDITSATASKAGAEAGLINARATLDQTTVTAPRDGVVLQKYVEQGTIITSGLSLNSSGTSIVQIGDVSRMYADVAVDETDIASIHMGEKVDIAFDAYPHRSFGGKVTKINPLGVVESNVTTIHVRVEVDNSAAGFSDLKPGMNATCEFIELQANDVVNVPSEAVHTEGDQTYVEIPEHAKLGGPEMGHAPSGTPPGPPPPSSGSDVVTDIKTSRRTVTIGIVGNDTTEIKQGLQDGEPIVVSKDAPSVEEDTAVKAAFGGGGPGGPPPGGGRK